MCSLCPYLFCFCLLVCPYLCPSFTWLSLSSTPLFQLLNLSIFRPCVIRRFLCSLFLSSCPHHLVSMGMSCSSERTQRVALKQLRWTHYSCREPNRCVWTLCSSSVDQTLIQLGHSLLPREAFTLLFVPTE